MSNQDDMNRRTSGAARSSSARRDGAGSSRRVSGALSSRSARGASGGRSPASRRPAPRGSKPAPSKRSPWKPVLRIGGLVVALIIVALGVTGCVMYNEIAAGLPDPSKPLKGTDRTTQVLDRSGKPITDLFADQNRQYVPLKEIPRALREAVIATEDQRYYEHPGVDLLGMLRALLTDIRAGAQVQGGSTITQQYVKQAFVGDERSIKRKVSEAILAYRVEQRYSKDQILEMYLNTIYFGHASYGVQTAAKTYFGKPVQMLGVAECAMIAGVIKSPGRYSPYLDAEAARNRRDTVLTQMRDQGYVDVATYGAAITDPVNVVGLKKGSKIAPYFIEYLKELLVAKYGEAAVYRGGLRITTTLDLKMQAAAEAAVRNTLNRAGDPSAALVAMDPKTGQLLAMVGGRDFKTQQYNVAVQGHRQSGSAFKPFVLVRALIDGVSPEQTMTSGPIKIPLPGGQTWSVTGAHGLKGPMRLRAATWESVNSVFAQLIMKVGPAKVLETAKAMGITTTITPVPAVALGGMGEGVTPLEMTNAYATLANSGRRMTPYAVLEVKDADGAVLESAKPAGVKALDPAVAYLATDMLRGVITNGTGKSAAIGRPAAGKTGTTQKYRDAWFCGYTPDLATVVWVGYTASQKEMTSVHGIKVTGGSFPAKIWAVFMKRALSGRPKTSFKRPNGLTDARICLESGCRATQFCLKTGPGLFLDAQELIDCPVHTVPVDIPVPKLIGLSKQDAISALQKLLLKYAVMEKNVPGVAAGIVADQDPKPGSKAGTATIVTLTVSNGGVSGGKPPVAAFDWTPIDAKAGAAVKFDATASTDDGAVTKWVWEFGDGAKDTVSGKIASHTYVGPGSYDVTLWVTDDAGNVVSLTKQIKVK